MTRCSEASRSEPLGASAPARRFWYAVEHPGPWPAKPLDEAVLGGAASWLVPLADRADTTVVLVRQRDSGSRRVWRADTVSHTLEVGDVGDVAPEFAPSDTSLTLVCTHARRDQCCAILGRPLLDVIPGALESSHIGGHRFAPTVLLLPAGIVLGRCTPTDWPRIADLGPAALPFYRGRTGLTPAMQAADTYARQRWGLGLTEYVVVEPLSVSPHAFLVTHADTAMQVDTSPSDAAAVLSCGRDAEIHRYWTATSRA